MFWLFSLIFSVLVGCTKKNLATLAQTASDIAALSLTELLTEMPSICS
jgi:hypothetical protein